MESAAVVFRSDQEHATLDLINEVARRRHARSFVEQYPVGSSASNGIFERAVQSVEGHVRTIRDALQRRIRVEIPSDQAIIAWMVEYASVLLNRYEVGKDGKTAYERLRGWKSKVLGVEFGEIVHFRRAPIGDRKDKLDSFWEDGVYLGHRTVSGESIIVTQRGVYKTRTLRRKPYEDRL